MGQPCAASEALVLSMRCKGCGKTQWSDVDAKGIGLQTQLVIPVGCRLERNRRLPESQF